MTRRTLVAWRCPRCERTFTEYNHVKRAWHSCVIPGRPTTTQELQRIEEP